LGGLLKGPAGRVVDILDDGEVRPGAVTESCVEREAVMKNTNDTRGVDLGGPLRSSVEGLRTSPREIRHLLEAIGIPFSSAGYGRGRTIFRQGDSSDNVIHVESGNVLLAVSTRSGHEAICGVLGAGAFLGEEALVGQPVRRHSAIAVTATRALVIAKPHMLALLHAHPVFADRFIEHLVTRNARLEVDLTDQLLYPAEHRLMHTLLVLAGCDDLRPCRCALPDLSQEIIAEMVGTTRSRVNRFMGRFRRCGFIEEDGGQLYINTSRLPSVCDDYRVAARALPSRVRRLPRRKTDGGIEQGDAEAFHAMSQRSVTRAAAETRGESANIERASFCLRD
jgi:CRP-like cAMP-binding protein